MIEKIDSSNIQDLIDKTVSKQPGSTGTAPAGDADVSLQVDYASYIDMAVKIARLDSDAVDRATSLLLTGQLDNPEAIRAAAAKIADFGF